MARISEHDEARLRELIEGLSVRLKMDPTAVLFNAIALMNQLHPYIQSGGHILIQDRKGRLTKISDTGEVWQRAATICPRS